MRKYLVVLVLMPVMSLADVEKIGGVTWTYKVSSAKVTVKGAEPCVGTLEIPQTLGGYPVSSIGAAAFSDCGDLTEIVIPEGVVDIGAAAFCDCIGLTAVTIPSTLASIADAAFEGCVSLTTIYVSAGDTEEVKAMIADSDSGIAVDSLTFVEMLEDGGPYKETVNGIEWTFMVEHGMASVGCGTSGASAISREIAGEIEIPSTLGGCRVMIIGGTAFQGCNGLTSVTISEGVMSIDMSAFSDCSGLTSISVNEESASYCSVDGVLYNKAKTKLVCCPGGKTGDVAILEGVMNIGYRAFFGCSGLTSVTIPPSVTSIGAYAFWGAVG